MKRVFRTFVLIASCALASLPSYSQTVPAPTVVSPVNLCLNSTAAPLSATGSNLQWVNEEKFVVGGLAALADLSLNINTTTSNKITYFSTTAANVIITSVDYTKPLLSSVTNLRLGIFDSNGNLIQQSTTRTSIGVLSGEETISNVFSCKLEKPGVYSIRIVEGSGTVTGSLFTSDLKSDLVNITGVSGTERIFSNIKYVTTTPPVPSTKATGTYNYYVTQTINGKTSTAANIKVNVTAALAPVVQSPITLCQGSVAPILSATGQNLVWTRSISSSIGGLAVHTTEQNLMEPYWFTTRLTANKTFFTTNLPYLTVRSVDYYIPANSSVNGLRLALYNEAGDLIANSSTTTTLTAGASPVKVTNVFNYTINAEGNYAIGFSAGAGEVGRSATATNFPVTEANGAISITGNQFASDVFNNIQFSVATESSTNPTPSTNYVGTTTYYVSQTVNGCSSQPATVIVNVNGVTSTVPGVGCANSTVTLRATASPGYTLNWYDSLTGASKGTGETFTTPTTLTQSRTYYVSATNGSCTTSRVPVQAIIGGYTWKGTTNTNWDLLSNWTTCVAVAPTASSDLTIPETSRVLTLEKDLTVNNLILQGNAKIILNGKTLTVNSISGTGIIVGSSTSSLVIKGSAVSPSLKFDQTTPGSTNALLNLKIENNSNTVSLETPLVLKGSLNITGNSVLRSDGYLVLEATKTSNANIGSLAGGGSVTGNVKVQTYLQGSTASYRNFRTLTSPVFDVSSPAKGYKIAGYKSKLLVTGPGGEANGFDASPNNGSTIKYYNEPKKNRENQYLYPANATTEAIAQGKGIYFYFRGNKLNANGSKFVKVNGAYGTPEDVVMEYMGQINSGNISPTITYTNNPNEGASNGFNLIGNPYPSVIDWDSPSIEKVNIDKTTIWVQKQNGSFAIYNGSDSTNGGSRFLLPGQGFFIKATGANPSITFKEGAKAATVGPPVRLMDLRSNGLLLASKGDVPRTQALKKRVSLTMVKDEYTSDETVVVLNNNNSSDTDPDDISYMGEAAVNLTTITPDNNYLAINYLPETSGETEVKLYATASESGEYKLSLTKQSGLDDSRIYLKDNYTNKQVDLKSEPTYNFTIDKATAATFGGDRFSLVVKAPVTLPIELLSIESTIVGSGVQLKWITASEKNSNYFEVESSVDGKVFKTLAKITAAGNSNSKLSYSYVDTKPFAGINYYRLKKVDSDGEYAFSKVVAEKFSLTNQALDIIIFPNPASESIHISGNLPGKTGLSIYALDGRKIMDSNNRTLDVRNLQKGGYIIEVVNKETGNVLKKSKVLIN
ncbi:T9SS type A sorting domain-containing protein [Desertivirga brevis]|uniref:Ig-like domain-containing protein n=1 Tax=Desertivirga brevis TaxID=2810310 RepID=UPI001A97BD4C|nr:T9SS type A sorting domain-containing protein [Pedobacter sp. SYSU D00873]